MELRKKITGMMELGSGQNEKKYAVGLRAKASAPLESIDFRCKSHEWIEKCLFYSAI
jgi:hypothetical protein